MEDLRELVRSVMEEGYLISLATVDGKGVWVADVIYVSDDKFNVYWKSATGTRHSAAIEGNPDVAGTITLNVQHGELGVSIQMAGKAKRVGVPGRKLVAKYLARRKRSGDASLEIDPGTSWYRFTPTVIELTHEPLFGYNKRRFDPSQ